MKLDNDIIIQLGAPFDTSYQFCKRSYFFKYFYIGEIRGEFQSNPKIMRIYCCSTINLSASEIILTENS